MKIKRIKVNEDGQNKDRVGGEVSLSIIDAHY